MNDLISRQGAIVAVKDALLTWSYMPKWRDDKIVDAVIGVESATDNNVGAKLSTLKIERAISGLTEWQKHVQTDSDIDRDISVAVKVLKAQLGTNLAEVGTDCISRQSAIEVIDAVFPVDPMKSEYAQGIACGAALAKTYVEQMPSVQPETEWNNHTVACLLAELFGDDCACNYNGIDEWLPEKCEVIDACPNPVGVACWEQFLKHRAGRRTDE